MKAITKEEKLPKFIKVSEKAEKTSYNKFLSHPWKKGELVKVATFEEQVRSDKYDDKLQYFKPNNDPEHFRRNFVKVIRKNEKGQWALEYVAGWENFELLTPKK